MLCKVTLAVMHSWIKSKRPLWGGKAGPIDDALTSSRQAMQYMLHGLEECLCSNTEVC